MRQKIPKAENVKKTNWKELEQPTIEKGKETIA